MGIMQKVKDKRGQMTIELMATLPAIIIIALISINAGTYLSECALFDRVFCEAVRVHASSPGYGFHAHDALGPIKEALLSQMAIKEPQVDISIEDKSFGLYQFKATFSYAPSLFGREMRNGIFGAHLPLLNHSVCYTLDCYRPGVVI